MVKKIKNLYNIYFIKNYKKSLILKIIILSLLFYLSEDKIRKFLICHFNLPHISIIIPIFNSEKYLTSCLNNVINQTLKNIEILCIDDGSQDKSINILTKYAELDKRIIIFTQNNKGSGIARNVGIKNSRGKYISFMDSDDLYPDNYTLELMYKKAIMNNANICGGAIRSFREKNNQIFFSKTYGLFKNEGVINYYNYQYHFGYYRFIYNKKFLKRHKLFFPNYLRYQDPPFFIKAMIHSKHFYALKEVTYLYRTSHKKINWSERKIIDELKALSDCISYSEQYKLNKLYCNIIKNLNINNLFLTPFKLFYNNKKVVNIYSQILLNNNYNKLKNKKCSFKFNHIYSHLLKLY